MSAERVTYPYNWSKDSTEEGDEVYTLQWKVYTTSALDGPDVAWTAAGLPIPGSSLNCGGTVNPWAFFQGKGSAKLVNVNGNRKLWDLTTVFSTKPNKRCAESKVSSPLLEPPIVKGSFAQTMEQVCKDKDGSPIENTVHELFTGPLVQVPKSRPVVELQMNVAWINLAWMAEYADSVNNAVWWSQPARTIKCTIGPWERVLYGNCYYYFVVRFTFELRYETWDLSIPNMASIYRLTATDPWEYAAYKGTGEDNMKGYVDATTGYKTATANNRTFRVLREKNFAAVGWPASLI